MVLPASALTTDELMAKNPCVCQTSYETGSVTTSQASITGKAGVLCFVSAQASVLSLSEATAY